MGNCLESYFDIGDDAHRGAHVVEGGEQNVGSVAIHVVQGL